MVATFAFIGLFAIGSVDAIITGGADFAPGSAYAAEYHGVRTAAPAPVAVATVEEPKPEDAAKSAEAAEVDYSFTTETLLGGPELELLATPLFEDMLADGAKVEQPEPFAFVEAEAAAF